jgi:hypothetical protein
MNKISSVALGAVLVVAGVGASASAEARPFVRVGVGCPGDVVIAPFGYGRPYYGPYFYAHGRYWRHEFDRDRFDRFHHERWDRR